MLYFAFSPYSWKYSFEVQFHNNFDHFEQFVEND